VCLIVVAWRVSADYPLVVAANRDEFFDRRTMPAAFWSDAPQVLAGRDMKASGTWMGITRTLRFAALTNVREPDAALEDAPSRGLLVSEFLTGRRRPNTYLRDVARQGKNHNGFNLLVADRNSLFHCSNRGAPPEELPPGIYGLSNHRLDTPWPKLEAAKAAFAKALNALPDVNPAFDLLADDTIAPDEALPDTGVGPEWERLLSAVFVKSTAYGTRSSTVIAVRADNSVRFVERRFGPGGSPAGGTDVAFMAEG
jgi:uncharacterized protein with NRDE domain